MEIRASSRVRLGAYEFDLRAGELLRGEARVVLQEQPLQILRMLVEAHGEVVTREEIKQRLWPNDTVVEFDHSIHTAINKLRKAFDDPANAPAYIETVARRGYRLMVPVETSGDSSGDSSSGESDARPDLGVEIPPKAKLEVGRLTGKVVSHYRVLEVIGGGGMGLVYRAEDLKLGRAVALKFLPEEVGDDPKARERFEREAHAVSALNHLNICTVHDFDEYEGHPFIAMELLQGKTLRDHLADGRFRLTQPEGLEIAIQIASGLEAAHEKGIIHRDIKPANIFITEKNVAKILDFGVAKVLSIETSEHPRPANIGPDGAPEVGRAQSSRVGRAVRPGGKRAAKRRLRS
jgi:DNA-binding winged helix-turn-helix (wHTH) protein